MRRQSHVRVLVMLLLLLVGTAALAAVVHHGVVDSVDMADAYEDY